MLDGSCIRGESECVALLMRVIRNPFNNEMRLCAAGEKKKKKKKQQLTKARQ